MRVLAAVLLIVAVGLAWGPAWAPAAAQYWSAPPYLVAPGRLPLPVRPPIREAMLAAHNAVRARVGMAPLVWSAQAAAVAQDWADTLVATHRFAHRPGNRYGENLYAMTGGTASAEMAVGMWAGEARDYDIRSNRCAAVCGHYTQVVWRTTRAVGCGVAAGGGQEVWVCDYDPPGNVNGDRPY